jgi:hypothetical protein
VDRRDRARALAGLPPGPRCSPGIASCWLQRRLAYELQPKLQPAICLASSLLRVRYRRPPAITRFVAWVGAVLHTAELEDKTWFIVLLVAGLLSFGFIAMIVYLIAGPDDPRPVTAMPATAKPASRDLQRQSA